MRGDPPRESGQMNATADVIVVGGGAMGASISYHLADAGSGRVLLLERFARGELIGESHVV